jgi:hypothetical protein
MRKGRGHEEFQNIDYLDHKQKKNVCGGIQTQLTEYNHS